MTNKLEVSVQALASINDDTPTATPAAFFSDLIVTDSRLQVIDRSFWRYQGLSPKQACSLNRLAVRNCVTGCTMVLNRSAVKACLPIAPSACMHDWWCALAILANGGKLISHPMPTMYYRQHAANSVGAQPKGWLSLLSKLRKGRRNFAEVLAVYKQAQLFYPGLSWPSFLVKKISALIERP